MEVVKNLKNVVLVKPKRKNNVPIKKEKPPYPLPLQKWVIPIKLASFPLWQRRG
jgi:hypothetical protein